MVFAVDDPFGKGNNFASGWVDGFDEPYRVEAMRSLVGGGGECAESWCVTSRVQSPYQRIVLKSSPLDRGQGGNVGRLDRHNGEDHGQCRGTLMQCWTGSPGDSGERCAGRRNDAVMCDQLSAECLPRRQRHELLYLVLVWFWGTEQGSVVDPNAYIGVDAAGGCVVTSLYHTLMPAWLHRETC